MDSQYLTKTELAKRWSMSLINKYYPQCDKEKPNPYYWRGSPMQLYDVNKVAQIESKESFKADLEKAIRKKEIAQENADKRKKMSCIDYANCLHIKIPEYKQEDVFALLEHDKYFMGRNAASLAWSLTRRVIKSGKIRNQNDADTVYDVLVKRVVEAYQQKYEWTKIIPLDYLVK